MHNDIFVLYKQEDIGITSGVNEFVRNLSGNVWKTKRDDLCANLITVKEYKENAGEANLYESQISSILVCIVDDELFYDSCCRKIWDYFWNEQLGNSNQIIFPVMAEVIKADDFNTDKLKMLDSIKNKLGSYILNDQKDMEKLYPLIYDSYDSQKDKTTAGQLGNIHIIKTSIPSKVDTTDEKSKIELKKAFEEIDDELKSMGKSRKYKDLIKGKEPKPVCVIYTGGTAGSMHDEHGEIVNAEMYDLIAKLPLIKKDDFKVDIDFYKFKDLFDSSNMGSKHWVIIAEVIERLYDNYQGFVIIHGVNTMAYTASALSFMLENVDKPIILTGAELPLTAPHSDAPQNIQKAIEIAAHESRNEDNFGDICILFGRRLIKGNRATKQIALDTTEGFYAPNFYDMATVAHDRYVIDARYIIDSTVRPQRKLDSESKFDNNGQMSTKDSVSVIDVYPDMNMDIFEEICESNVIEAIILRTYGTGGVPDANERFTHCLKELKKKNKLVVILTQCPRGTVEFRIAETNATLFNFGVISGGDMVTEAAYCKLKYLFAKFEDANDDTDVMKNKKIKAIKHYMMVNIKGELSLNMFIINISDKNTSKESRGVYKIKLYEHWANNPALVLEGKDGNEDERENFGRNKFSDDTYANFPSDPHFLSAVLRLSKVNIKTIGSGRASELILNIEIFISERDEGLGKNNWEARYKGNIAKLRNNNFHKDAIDIDITNRANEILRSGKRYSILIKCTNCIENTLNDENGQIRDIEIDKVDILLSVRDKARLEGNK